MDHQQSITSMSKYIAQSKELIEKYLKENKNLDDNYQVYLNEALILLNHALDNVVI